MTTTKISYDIEGIYFHKSVVAATHVTIMTDKSLHISVQEVKNFMVLTTFLKSVFVWKAVDVNWDTIWQKCVPLFTDPVCIPNHFNKSVKFSLHSWDHYVCQNMPGTNHNKL